MGKPEHGALAQYLLVYSLVYVVVYVPAFFAILWTLEALMWMWGRL